MKPVDLIISKDSWPIKGSFNISRGSKKTADTVTVELTDGQLSSYGECLPYGHYGETQDSVASQIESLRADLHKGLSRLELLTKLPAGSARNAVDCALIDLECKSMGITAGEMLKQQIEPLSTAFTLSLDSPQEMAKKAKEASHSYHLLKLKCGAEDDAERIASIRAAAPDIQLIVDANEGWSEEDLPALFEVCQSNNIDLIEQPLPEGHDELLAEINRPVPVCADESFRQLHNLENLNDLARKYDAVNIKLDKTGGLTAALNILPELKSRHLDIMAGCMVSTSLSMAPAFIIAQHAKFVDLDGPLLLEKDRQHGLVYADSLIEPPSPLLWG